jgi:hypothetical protein
MCATCVAQGAVYVGGALAGLQVMAARARMRRHGIDAGATDRDRDGPGATATAGDSGEHPVVAKVSGS